MVEFFVKYFSLIVCSLYVYTKLLNLNKKKKSAIIDVAFASALSIFLYFLWISFRPLVIPVLIVFSIIYISYSTKTELGLSITTTAISFGINFSIYMISSSFAACIFFFAHIQYTDISSKAIFISTALIQLLASSIPFRFRRLKSGMPFLKNRGGGNTGVLISTALLCSFFVISNAETPESIYYLLPLALVFLCGVCIFLWWRNKLKKVYIEKLRAAEIQNLHDVIDEKDRQIQQIKESNELLAKVIHKDNKLIPAMELAVRTYLQAACYENPKDIQKRGQALLRQLEDISFERAGIIAESHPEIQKLPQTGIFQIDSLMTYMLNKAFDNKTGFKFALFASVKYMVENVISLSDLRTILADLIENAIIAAKYSNKKEILVSIEIVEECYMIDVFDTGIPFEEKTLALFGKQRYTTHADTGGSGIGLITVSEILQRNGASFIIDEFCEENSFFTKKVSVKFDNRSQYIVKGRGNEDSNRIYQEDRLALKV